MESQLQRPTPHGQHRYEEDPHHNVALQSVMEGEGETEHNHHGEKKSVLKKVKDKAKKIKDKITHSGHSHDEEDYDEEDEETVAASDVHVVNEPAFISGTALPKQTGLNLEKPTSALEDRTARSEIYDVIGNAGMAMGPDHRPTTTEVHQNIRDDPMFKTSAPMHYIPNTRKEEYDPVFKTDPYISNTRKEDDGLPVPVGAPSTDLPVSTDTERRAMSEPDVQIGSLMELDKDPHAPGSTAPPNYQTKVVDPTGQGGGEAEVGPLLERLGNLHVSDESEEKSYTGSHDQFNPETLDTERPEYMPRDTVTGKISAIADKASYAKNAVASKLGYSGSGSSQRQEGQESSKATALESVREYGHKVAEGLAPVYDKVAGAGSAIMSKVEGRGGGSVVSKEGDKGVSVQEYLAEKFSPGDEDKELSKVITEAIHRKKERGPVEPVKETITVEAVASNERAAAGVVDRVKDAIGSWLGKSHGQQQAGEEGLKKEVVSKVQEPGKEHGNS